MGDDWDARHPMIREIPAGGSTEDFDEFVEDVRDRMITMGNKIGRPLTMKVIIEVADETVADPAQNDSQEEMSEQ